MKSPSSRAAFLLSLVALVACGDDDGAVDASDTSTDASDAADVTPDGGGSAYRTVDCIDVVGSDAPGMTCGFIEVPQNRVRDTGRTIELFFVRPTTAPSDAPPVVVLAGGPGSSHGGFAARQELPLTMSTLLGREVIYVDQRGVPASIPDTLCPRLDEAETRADETAAVTECRDRLEADGVDVHSYNTLENAADIAALPAALGVPQIDLIAGSYATRLAGKILARHPESVRVAVLGGVDVPGASGTPPGSPAFSELVATASADFEARCAVDEACRALVPSFDLPTIQGQLSALLARDGVVMIAGIPFDSLGALSGTFFSMMYVAQVRNMFFAALYHAANETNETFFTYVGEGNAEEGLTFVRQLLGAARNAVFGGASLMSVATLCYDGDGGSCGLLGDRVDDYPSEAFTSVTGSDHPVLMLSGALDPATPAPDAADFVALFPNGQRTVFPCLGHDVSRISNRANGDCVVEQVRAFLESPGAELPACEATLCDELPLVPTRRELSIVVSEYVEGFGG